ncbi:hypothetical protein Pssp01_25340 [Pseudomonas sp. NBRC 100443]|nr:hypothetical protein Pssp01_25340 [Pseudomonas sp. NBRC 100443]
MPSEFLLAEGVRRLPEIADGVRSYAIPPTPFPCRSAPCARFAGRARSYKETRRKRPNGRSGFIRDPAGRPACVGNREGNAVVGWR